MNIPWTDPDEFNRVLSALSFLDSRLGPKLDPVRETACRIYNSLENADSGIDRLCQVSCPECQDNCCKRATIWYDLRDLLCLHFGPARLPECQIFRINTPKGRDCSRLTPKGCGLPRTERPFVCTWYFCPAQKLIPQYLSVVNEIDQIKQLRSEMEDLFCTLTA